MTSSSSPDGLQNGICSPCAAMMMDAGILGNELRDTMDIMCTKIDSKFCFPAFSNMMDGKVSCESAPCISAIFRKMGNIAITNDLTTPLIISSFTSLMEASCSGSGAEIMKPPSNVQKNACYIGSSSQNYLSRRWFQFYLCFTSF